MRLILDTSGWYALVSMPDFFHQQALKIMNQQPELVVAYPVLEELMALLHHRVGKKLTMKAVGQFRRNSLISVVYLSKKDDEEIWKIYQASFSWLDYVDASVVWLSRKLEVPVFGFDQQLTRMGISLYSPASTG